MNDNDDPFANDPFFKSTDLDPDWNACIGRQGEEENYLDGYIEAAIELVDAIIQKQLFGKRDTLVLPILYNARHAIELSLKYATDRMVAAGIIVGGAKRDHNIKAYWDHLYRSAIGDEKLSLTIDALEPFIESLSRIDLDGQELRYHQNRDSVPSLANYSLANLKVIQKSLLELKSLIDDLQYRTQDFLHEHAAGSHTSRCSRRDLIAIAQIIPRRDRWSTKEFDEKKAVVMERYGLGSRQFSIALERIQANREMRAIIGMESALLHLSDDDIVSVVDQWRLVHPKREPPKPGDLGLDYFGPKRFEAIQHHITVLREVVTTLQAQLSPEKLADLETIYHFGRDGTFAEYYEDAVARKRHEHAVANAPQEKIRHLMEKTNFLRSVQVAVVKLGRLPLVERIKDL